MTPLVLAGAWIGLGILGVSTARAVRRGRVAIVAPLVAGGLGALTAVAATAGPFASVRFGGSFALGRPEIGFLVAVGPALAATLALAPRIDGGEVLAACLVAAATVVALGATHPVIWAMALAIGVGTLALRWIAVTPTRATLAAGRVAGLGAAALLGAAVLLPVQGPPSDVRSAIAGSLLAVGIGLLLGLVPGGGWAAGSGTVLRGSDLVVWALVLAPAALLGARVAAGWLGGRAADAFAGTLLVLGLLSALYGAVQAVIAAPLERHCRVLLTDLGLAAAALATRREEGALAVLLVLLAHLSTGPLLLNPPRRGLQRPRRLAWLALSGLPPSLSFWARLLALQALFATNGDAFLAGLAASAALAAAAVRGILEPVDAGRTAPAPLPLRALAWAIGVGALSAGLAPGWIGGHLFGVDLGAG